MAYTPTQTFWITTNKTTLTQQIISMQSDKSITAVQNEPQPH